MKCRQCGLEFQGNFCPNCGNAIGNYTENAFNNVQNTYTKNKKPFYKKGWFIALAIICVLIFLTNKNNSNEKKFDWNEIELCEFIPEPEKTYGEITSNRSDLSRITISKITKKEYKNYVQKCINEGFNIDLEYEPWDTVYGAFDEEGYSIRIIYSEYSEEMSITLKIPEQTKMKKIEWPTNGLGSVVPTPKSNLGDISWNNSNSFIVHLGNMTIADYNEYVKKCENQGFINDYSKSDKSYSATNSNGYKLHLMYLGGNVIEISIKAPEKAVENNITPPVESNNNETSIKPTENTENTKTTNTTKTSNNEVINKNFKDAMDSYEEFMNEYVAFMKKYSNSNGTDMSLILDYSKYMTKYATMCKEFEKWENEDLNAAETTYYIDVQARVTKKLLEVAY